MLKRIMLKTITGLVILLLIFSCGTSENDNDQVKGIIPKPEMMVMMRGYFKSSDILRINYTDPLILPVLNTFKEQLRGKVEVVISDKEKGNLVILMDSIGNKGEESYALNVERKKIILRSGSLAGIYYGLQTIRQLITFNQVNNKLKIQCCSILDSPRFAWRGVMIDESRHFFGMDKIKQLLDIMSMHKLNVFHWHLTDSPGWRIEIKKYPKLTSVGGKGNYSDPEAKVAFYTQEEIKEIVRYASDRFVEVIPEIDMPGHATAANRAYPEYSGGGSERYPDFTFNPGNEGTYLYLTNIIKEVAGLFPSKYIHTGGDEVNYGNQHWSDIPEVKKLMKNKNLLDLKAVEAYFNKRISDSILALNKKVIGWDEIVDTGLDPLTSVAMWWRHDKQDQLFKALVNNYHVVLCPRIPLYFDFVQYETHKDGRKWRNIFCPLEMVYQFPVDTLSGFEKYYHQILGIQANLWTERIQNEDRFDFMLYPRLSALAEAAWSIKENKLYSDFLERLKPMLSYYDDLNIKYFNPFSPDQTPEPKSFIKIE